jgi:hypothetical protein
MQIFKSESEARKSLHEKPKVYINALCPFDVNGKICGSHCALFYYDKGDGKRSPYIILGCKAGTDKKLHV